MSDDIIDIIAAGLAGEANPYFARDDAMRAFTTLRSAGYAIVALPTGETLSCGELGQSVQFDAPNDIGGVSGMNGTVSDSESVWTPDEARTLAAALLAAAAAEADR